MLDTRQSRHSAKPFRRETLLNLARTMNIKSLAFIPARGGSKGLPQKNILQLGGKPLLAYTIEAAVNTGFFSRIVVSTDDPVIAEVALEWGAEVPFLRPPDLAGDTALISQAFEYTKERLSQEGFIPDLYVILSPTSPFRNRSLMLKLLGKLLEGYANVFACKHISCGVTDYYDCNEGKALTRILPYESMCSEKAMFLLGIFSGHWLTDRLPAWGTYVEELRHPAHCVDIDGVYDLELAKHFIQTNIFDFNE